MAILRLTEARINSLPLGSGIHRDEVVKGLMVICHKSTKSYAVQGDVRRNGRHVRTVRKKIDRVDRIGLSEARGKAKVLMSQIQSGVDPSAGPDETGITLEAALEEHCGERELSPRTESEYRYHLSYYLKRFRKRAITDITRTECRELQDKLIKRHGRTSAASAMRTMRAVINTARRIDETIGGNPMDAVRIPVPPSRQVDQLDIPDWWKRTEALTPLMRDLHRSMLLTGARRSSITQVKCADVDLDRKIMRFTHMKMGGDLLFPMGPKLAKIVESRMKSDEILQSPWLWPSPTSKTGHIREPKRAGLPSPHEMRHHCRTLMIAAGVPYAESALLLGQKLPGASGGYVHPQHLVENLRQHSVALESYVLSKIERFGTLLES